MSTLHSAFTNLHNFLHFVALPNCVELSLLEQAEDEELEKRGQLADLTRRNYSRVLFNAVVSVDSVLDYAFHAEGGGKDQVPFNRRLFDEEPALEALREVSNALKHCVTRSDSKLNGSEVVQTTLEIQAIFEPIPQIQLALDANILERAKTALDGSFRFWVKQGQDMDARAPEIDRSIQP